MKKMSCKQLGGACDKEFHANTFEEIAELIRKHRMEMFQANDKQHLKAMNYMKKLMTTPNKKQDRIDNRWNKFMDF